MSTKERADQIEQALEKQNEDHGKCIFCYERKDHSKDSIFNQISDKAVKEFFIKNGLTSCNHERVEKGSVYFSDFIAGSLLHIVWDIDIQEQREHDYTKGSRISKQQDYDFAYSVFKNKDLMMPAYKWFADDRQKNILENIIPYEKEDKEFWKQRASLYPVFLRLVKEMYESV